MKLLRFSIFSLALLAVSLVLSAPSSRAQTGAVRARVTQAVDMQNLVTLRGNVHPLARPEYDQGVAPDDLPMERMLLVLQRGADQEASLRQVLDQQQVKSSPYFHLWLTPEQFGKQFGPADADIQAVTDWLASQGFTVKKVAAGRTVIEFSGSAGLVRQALGTEVHKFHVQGQDYWANASDPQIPAALAPVVAGFASLNNFPRHHLNVTPPIKSRPKRAGKGQPQFTFCTDSSDCYLLVGPGDFAKIYNVGPLWTAGTDGTGQTIAVVGETNINRQDVVDFRNMFGLPPSTSTNPNIILNGPDPGILTDGEETEADLDVEWSGGIAKGATVDFVVSESTESTAGIDLSALYIIDNNLAPVMSESYGGCEEGLGAAGNDFYSAIWEQAAAQGITVLLGAGDSGSAGCDSVELGEIAAQYGLAVSGFASTPFNVAVGGTDFLSGTNDGTYWSQTNTSPYQTSALSYIPESTWNYSCADSGSLTACTPPPNSTYLEEGAYLAAGGGGSSAVYSKPSWQSGTGVPSDGARDIPDISLLASGYYIICEMDANSAQGGSSSACDLNAPYEDFIVQGGTSAAVQAFAGIVAMVNQAHGRQGNANYVLYPMAATSGASCNSSTAPPTSSSCVFYDITSGNNSVICYGGSPDCSNNTSGSGEYGIMISNGAAAYPTTPDYDLATGLGSVNATNLVNNWKSNFTLSTPTLLLSTGSNSLGSSPITLTHGQAVNFKVSVAGSGGTPTGDVSLIAPVGTSGSNSTGIGPFTLSSGSVTGSTIFLPGGSYKLTAHYAGNGTFAASDSSPGIQATVSPEASNIVLSLVDFSSGQPVYDTSSANLPYGAAYFLRVDVTNNTSNTLCFNQNTEFISYPCPTGMVKVTPAPTDLNPPAGTTPGQYTLNSQGYAEDQPVSLSPGTYPFMASYGGDISYNKSATINPLTVTITLAQTQTSITSIPTNGTVGQQVSVSATVATQSYGAAPGGTMQLLNNGTAIGSAVAVTGTAANSSSYAMAQATIPLTLTAGNLSISAKYSGDTNYGTSTSAASAIAVSDFTLSANPSPVTISAPGQPGTSTISVSPENVFTGIVDLSVASGCPTGATCTFANPSVNVTSTTAQTDLLTITTTAPSSSSAPPAVQPRVPPGFRLPLGFIWLLAGALALAMLLRSSAIRRRPAAYLLVTALLVVALWMACGGGGSSPTPTPTPEPGVGLSSNSLTFTSQNVGTTSSAQSVMLTNTGTATLVETISLTGTNAGDFSESDNCNGSVAAGSNCSIGVKFTPTAAGTRTAAVSIADNASGSPQSIGLSGTGAAASTPTPAGTYSVVINAVVNGSLSHTLTLKVTVQ